MKSNRTRKCFSCTKDGLKQQELEKYFPNLTKTANKTISKIIVEKEKGKSARKKLFNDEIIVIDDEESVMKKNVLEESVTKKEVLQESVVKKEVLEENIVKKEVLEESVAKKIVLEKLFNNEIIVIDEEESIVKTEVIEENSSVHPKHTAVRVAGTSRSLTSAEVPRTVNQQLNIVTLNKPVKQMASPEKVKPRVLQNVSLRTNLDAASTSSCNNKSLSQNSASSDDTIIYDPFEGNWNETDSFYQHLSPTSRLIQKIDANVQLTKLSSVAYRKTDFAPQEEVAESPRKKPKAAVKTEENELTNPRVVNFVTKIVKYVFKQPHLKSLFNDEEVRTIERFFTLPQPEHNYFCYKLYTRLPQWYNVFKLCEKIRLFMDTNEILSMRECLQRNGFVLTDYSSEPVQQLLNLLSVKELKEIRDSFRLKAKIGKKALLIEYLLENCNKQTTLTLSKNSAQILQDRVGEKLGPCVKLSDKLYDLFYRLHLLYALGSSEFSKPHDLYQFLDCVENGSIVLPEKFIDTAALFSSREEFLEFAKASEYKDELLNAMDKKNREIMVEISRVAYKNLQDILKRDVKIATKPSYLLRFSAGSKYASILNIATKHLSAAHPNEVKEWLNLLLSQRLYCQHKRGLWYDQLVMMEIKYFSNYEMGVQFIIKALRDKSISQVALHDLSMRGLAIKNCKKYSLSAVYIDQVSVLIVEPPDIQSFPSVVIEANALKGNESGKKRTYIETTSNRDQYLISVEQIALNHYKRNGFSKGFHCEGSLLVSLFFVLFWDIIYSTKVPSAFINEIQYIPLDLYSEKFYENRKNDIDQRLIEIRNDWDLGELFLFVMQNWNNHSHKRSLILQDLVENADELIQIVCCIGRECLASLLERLARDFKQFHSGLPDLFVWNFEERTCRFVEVKGEKDKLSMKQKLWLNYLRMAKAEIEVCHVHSIGSKRTAKIANLLEGQ